MQYGARDRGAAAQRGSRAECTRNNNIAAVAVHNTTTRVDENVEEKRIFARIAEIGYSRTPYYRVYRYVVVWCTRTAFLYANISCSAQIVAKVFYLKRSMCHEYAHGVSFFAETLIRPNV